jgi:hypothetical protein
LFFTKPTINSISKYFLYHNNSIKIKLKQAKKSNLQSTQYIKIKLEKENQKKGKPL